MRPAEVWGLSDQELESKLQQAAREYSVDTEELLDEASRSSAITPDTGAIFPLNSKVGRIPCLLRCRVCRRLRQQPYRIDFTPHVFGAVRLLRDPAYACHHCLPIYLADQQVQQITRLTQSEIPKPPNVRARFAAIAILVLSSLYIWASGNSRESRGMRVAPATVVASIPFADEFAPASRGKLATETSKANFPAASVSIATALEAAPSASSARSCICRAWPHSARSPFQSQPSRVRMIGGDSPSPSPPRRVSMQYRS